MRRIILLAAAAFVAAFTGSAGVAVLRARRATPAAPVVRAAPSPAPDAESAGARADSLQRAPAPAAATASDSVHGRVSDPDHNTVIAAPGRSGVPAAPQPIAPTTTSASTVTKSAAHPVPAAASSRAVLTAPTPAGGSAPGEGRIARIFAAMQAKDAARVLEQMSDGDIAAILGELSERQAAGILAHLPPPRAATISRLTLQRGSQE